jgi:integrase/recombinase XerD
LGSRNYSGTFHRRYCDGRNNAEDEPITIIQAVTEYLADAKARELADATLYKLEIQLRKQFLTWCRADGYKLLKEFDLRAAQSFRASWTDGGLAKKKSKSA